MTRDHIIPKSRGGSSAVQNIALVCLQCNQEKADHTLDEFLGILYTKQDKSLKKTDAEMYKQICSIKPTHEKIQWVKILLKTYNIRGITVKDLEEKETNELNIKENKSSPLKWEEWERWERWREFPKIAFLYG